MEQKEIEIETKEIEAGVYEIDLPAEDLDLLIESLKIKHSCSKHRSYDENCADCIKANKDYKESYEKISSDTEVKGFNLKSK